MFWLRLISSRYHLFRYIFSVVLMSLSTACISLSYAKQQEEGKMTDNHILSNHTTAAPAVTNLFHLSEEDSRLVEYLSDWEASHANLQDLIRLNSSAALVQGRIKRQMRSLINNAEQLSQENNQNRHTRLIALSMGTLQALEVSIDALLQQASNNARFVLQKNKITNTSAVLNAMCANMSVKMRRSLGSFQTEIESLATQAACQGDLIQEQNIYAFCSAVTAERKEQARKHLFSFSSLLSCLSTRQMRTLETELIKVAEQVPIDMLSSSPESETSDAVRSQFQQIMAPIVFLLADQTRHFDRYDHPGRQWLIEHSAELQKAALINHSILNETGLFFINRFNGRLIGISSDCIHVPDTNAKANHELFRGPKGDSDVLLFSSGISKHTCNPLAAMLDQRSLNIECDVLNWVPAGARQQFADHFICDSGCEPLTSSANLQAPPRLPDANNESQIAAPYNAPFALASTGCGAGAAGGNNSTDYTGSRGMLGSLGARSCDFGVVSGLISTLPHPSQVFNNTFERCLFESRRPPSMFEIGLAYRPAGLDECSVRTEDAGTVSSDSGANDDEGGLTEEEIAEYKRKAAETFERAKELATAVFKVAAQVINFIKGGDFITEDDINAVVNMIFNAQLVDGAKFDVMLPNSPGARGFARSMDCAGQRGCESEIIIHEETCAGSVEQCAAVIVHEGFHAAFFFMGLDGGSSHELTGHEEPDADQFYSWVLHNQYHSDKRCSEGDLTCAQGCTTFEAAFHDQCYSNALNAALAARQAVEQSADRCATDACWNPMNDFVSTGGELCQTTPGPACPGQTVALCPPESPNCMCRDNDIEINTAVIRGVAWRAYCERAYDEDCINPTPPEGFMMPLSNDVLAPDNIRPGRLHP